LRAPNLLRHPPPRSTRFPYTTLFRSPPDDNCVLGVSHFPVPFDSSAVPLRELVTATVAGDEREIIERKEAVEIQRDDTALESKRSEEHTSELQSRVDLVCRLLLEKKT